MSSKASHIDWRDADATNQAIAQYLLETGKLEGQGLDRAQRLAQVRNNRLVPPLIELGLISERDAAKALAAVLGLQLTQPSDFPMEPLLKAQVSCKFLKSAKVIPVGESEDGLNLAMTDPTDVFAMQAIELIVGKPVIPQVALPSEIDAAIDRLYGDDTTAPERSDSSAQADEDIERLKGLASEAPVIRLVNRLIRNAVDAGASDVHVEPFENRVRVRYRIDGLLREVESPAFGLRAAIISRIKIMAHLDIAERRLPQDGRIRITSSGREIDLRVSIVPTLYGESAVIRILDRASAIFDFDSLGFPADAAGRLVEVLERPHGMLLVSGTTGSGKTTTLYTSLVRLNSVTRKVLTVEDPIEYNLEGINQIQVHPRIGLEFDTILRSILRQDPDVIMIGEIRDLKTAQIAVQAALTGHFVLSTVHTHNAASAIGRMLDMGVEDYLLASTLNGVLSQRLVRKLCPDCREPYAALPELAQQLQLGQLTDREEPIFYHSRGCSSCQQTGFRGRTVISEQLVMSDALRRKILSRAEMTDIHQVAVSEGMETMFEAGMRAALMGTTSMEEVLRVTRED